ncbi:MAG TPA: LysM peptidoglycan-binding domain-containing M23 family metallopeptidase [Myxococcota bacterium]|nr:LysM peptidoglycan-binding domain-containing M23 family metallopeptidase [Myxococcota bacterium]
MTQPQATPQEQRVMVPHTVAPGETLWRISKRYGTTVPAIMAANGIDDVRSVPTGARLLIPTTASVGAGAGGEGGRRGAAKTYASRDPRGHSGGAPQFAWPVNGEIISRFGMRHGEHHEGIDIRAAKGTPVHAAEAGRVIHADATLAGYGKMIVIKHSGRLYTVYAHNSKLLVEVGQFVEKGEEIALVGETGNATTPHLHFEIRNNNTPRDPLEYLQ